MFCKSFWEFKNNNSYNNNKQFNHPWLHKMIDSCPQKKQTRHKPKPEDMLSSKISWILPQRWGGDEVQRNTSPGAASFIYSFTVDFISLFLRRCWFQGLQLCYFRTDRNITGLALYRIERRFLLRRTNLKNVLVHIRRVRWRRRSKTLVLNRVLL